MTDAPSVAAFCTWADACVEALGAAREEIDALNVFPVPDSDTGTNLYLTFEAAAATARDAGDEPSRVTAAFVDGALRAARGNSGVIVSQLLRVTITGALRAASDEAGLAPRALASVLAEAARAAYVAVGIPVEGTILTVARVAADAAVAAADSGATNAEVLSAAADAARSALARTPQQLAALRRAGVVDAGGRGLCVVLDTTVRVLTGRWQERVREPLLGSHSIPQPLLETGGDVGGPAYEVMYLLDAHDDAVPALRQRLAELGDSLVVVGGDGLWNVHVHSDNVGAALEAGVAAGRPHSIRVTHFDGSRSPTGQASRAGRGVVVSAAGAGLHKLFGAAGAQVVSGGQRRSATADFLDAIRATGAAEVVVLPNDADAIPVAEAAAQQARGDGVRVAVIPTRVQVQGLAALAVHEPGRGFDDDVVAMTTAAGQTRHGAITRADRDAMTSAGPCRAGDVLGVLHGDFALVGDDLAEVAVQVALRLLDGGGELLTLVTGEGAPYDLAHGVAEAVQRARPGIDTVVYGGGQSRYPLLVAVE